MMTFAEYHKAVMRTASRPGHLVPNDVAHRLGLFGEAGEFVDIVKKHVAHGRELDREKAKLELGDVMWYCMALVDDGRWLDWGSNVCFAGPLPNESLELGRLIGKFLETGEIWDLHAVGRKLVALANILGFTWQEVAEANIAKLKVRYPEGFTEEAERAR